MTGMRLRTCVVSTLSADCARMEAEGTLSGMYSSVSGAQCAAASAAESRAVRSAATSSAGGGGRVENSI